MGMLILSLVISAASAKDFGVHGPVHPITERNPVKVIEERLSAIDPREIEEQIANTLEGQKLFTPLKGWSPTTHPRRFQHDPTYVVSNDIKDHKGRVLFKKGERVNPLALQPMEKNLLFIDGRRENDIQWALEEGVQSKIILVAGSPKSLMTMHQVPFYFDQGGALLQTFDLKHIPAKVTISEGQVWIEEIRLEDSDG